MQDQFKEPGPEARQLDFAKPTSRLRDSERIGRPFSQTDRQSSFSQEQESRLRFLGEFSHSNLGISNPENGLKAQTMLSNGGSQFIYDSKVRADGLSLASRFKSVGSEKLSKIYEGRQDGLFFERLSIEPDSRQFVRGYLPGRGPEGATRETYIRRGESVSGVLTFPDGSTRRMTDKELERGSNWLAARSSTGIEVKKPDATARQQPPVEGQPRPNQQKHPAEVIPEAQKKQPAEVVLPELQKKRPPEVVSPDAQKKRPPEVVLPEAQKKQPAEGVSPEAQKRIPAELPGPQQRKPAEIAPRAIPEKQKAAGDTVVPKPASDGQRQRFAPDENRSSMSARPNPNDFFRLRDGTDLRRFDQGGLLKINYGRDKAFTPELEREYRKLRSDPQVAFSIRDLDSGRVVAESANAGQSFYGASVSKPVVAAALLDARGGRLSPQEWNDVYKLIAVSDGATWGLTQKRAGGAHQVSAFTSRMGYSMNAEHAVGNINARDMTKFLQDVAQERFPGAEAISKIMAGSINGQDMSHKYLPTHVRIADKAGIWGANRHDAAILQIGNKRYGVTVMSSKNSEEAVAIMFGGLARQYLGVRLTRTVNSS